MNSNEPRYIKVRGAKAPEMQGTTSAGACEECSVKGIFHVKLIDASPSASMCATYANVHDELQKIYTKTPDAKTGNAFNNRKYCVFAISVTY